MNSNLRRLLFVLSVLGLVVSSCDERPSVGSDRRLGSLYRSVDADGWRKNDTLVFPLRLAELAPDVAADSLPLGLRLQLLVRASNAYAYRDVELRTFLRVSGSVYCLRSLRRTLTPDSLRTLRVDTSYAFHRDVTMRSLSRTPVALFETARPGVEASPVRTTAVVPLADLTLHADSLYELLVVHNMREWRLKGLTDLGLLMEKIPPRREDFPTPPAAKP